MDSKKVRTRFAPSPTGNLHVGGARTALFNYAYAKRMGGDFILRLDDTDIDRNIDDSAHKVMTDLMWLGIDWDHGLNLDGSTKGLGGPYRQSDRLDIYKNHAFNLVDMDLAYWDKTDPLNPCIRFKVPKNTTITFDDGIRGRVSFNTDVIDDFVILRSNGRPTYNFCTPVDDHLMDISHVIRADEHLNNTLPQILIYKAFGWDLPKFVHLSLIFGPDGKKLSKRHGASSVGDFRDRGFLPSALLNYLSLLGWSHPKGKDVFPMKDLVDNFSFKKVSPSPAIFDDTKLCWMNGVYIRNTDDTSLANLISGFDIPGDVDALKIVRLYKGNATFITDFKIMIDYCKKGFGFVLTNDSIDFMKNNPDGIKALDAYIKWLDMGSIDSFKYLTDDLKNSGLSTRTIFWTLRIAALGTPHGPDSYGIVDTIPRDVLLKRALAMKSHWNSI